MFSSPQTSSGSRSLCPLLLSRIPLLTNIFSCSLFFVSRVQILVSCFTEKVNLAHTNQSRGLLLTNHHLQLPRLRASPWRTPPVCCTLRTPGTEKSRCQNNNHDLLKKCVNVCLSLEFLFLIYQSNA